MSPDSLDPKTQNPDSLATTATIPEEQDLLKREGARLIGGKYGRLKVYEWPLRRESYCIGIDPAEGKVRDTSHKLSSLITTQLPDFSAICIIKSRTLEQVASYASLEVPAIFARKATLLAKIYNDAFVAVEANGPGIAVIREMERYGTKNFLQRQEYDKLNRTWAPMKGFRTTQNTRDVLILQFYQSLQQQDGIKLLDKESLSEMKAFRYNNRGKAEAASGCKDDRIFAAMLALEARRVFYRPEVQEEIKYRGNPDRWVWEQRDTLASKRYGENDLDAGDGENSIEVDEASDEIEDMVWND